MDMVEPLADGPVTEALHCRIDQTVARPTVTPLYQASAFSADSPYFYTRKANPNSEELEQALACLEQAAFGITATTGMTAISLVAALLRPGDHVVLGKFIYGCTFKFFQRLARSRGIRVTTLDLCRPEEIDRMPADVGLVFFETPTNPFLKTVSIAEVARRAKALNPSALVVVDNTWATPLFQRPLEHGADISLYSATKYFSGHSDVMGGALVLKRRDLADRLREERFYTGAILDPHSAWLLRRSLQTFALRMREHERVTAVLAEFLKGLPQIRRVHTPLVDGRQLLGYGGILFCDLREDLTERYDAFTRALRLFDTGTGMAAVTSMVARPCTGSHASLSGEEQSAMGIGPGLIRLCFGLEEVEDLKRDLRQALESLESAERAAVPGRKEACDVSG
jgi:cystathionine gamma-lyase/cystathionine gamma-lyase/homocysteine desulfhydrase